MKKKIGFIDLFIDEWHANNYPKWIRESALKDEFEVAMAWEKYTPEGKKGLQEWCKEQNVTPAASLEEVVDKCDCICVLAPSNPEVHEELAEYALKSGKPVYVDKPFALGRAAAQRMFDLARKHNTPLMSSSALRFSNELMEKSKQLHTPLFVNTCGGGGNFPEYAIHQIEMIVSLLGTGAQMLQVCGNKDRLTVTVRYPDQRLATMNYSAFWGFKLNAATESEVCQIDTMSAIFPNLLQKILEFYKAGTSLIPVEETIEIAAILDAAVKGMSETSEWIQID
ncbi:MAG: Gfo/Idh/MocA family oxidoreductase [Lentisphaeria bacterium]|nr:Gfo/Idh/MocA family oxidoreductase [Lentisphaeria bacterium]